MKNIFYSLIILSIVSCSNDKNETTLNQAINKTEIDSNLSYIQSADLLVTGDFDFGTVSQSASQSKIVTIKNTGLIPGKVKIDLTTIFQTNGIFSINYASSDCFVSSSYKILQPQYSCQIELLLNSGVTASGAIFAAIPLYDELASNTLIKNLQASVVISSTGSTPPVGKSCITAYHKDLITGKCVSDYKDCTPLISNAVIAKKHWNSVNQTFDSCLATSCVPSYAPANGGSSCALSQQNITINKLINQGVSNVYDSGTNALIGSCPVGSTSCNITVPALSNIRIESVGTTGYSFSDYADSNCLGTNFTCTKNNISTNLVINPLFSIQNYTLSLAVLPAYDSGNVTYTILKNGVACSTPACLSSFNIGQTVQITATPDSYVSTSSITLSDVSRSPTGVNPISFVFGTADIIATINLTDKVFSTQPTLSFTNGTLSGSNVSTTNTTLNLITTNATVAREILISNSSDCSVGSYETYSTPKVYNVIPNITSPLSVRYKNGTSLSTCKVYSVIPQNRTRDCSPQPTYSLTNGTQSSSNAGVSWGTCSNYTCPTNMTPSGGSCVANTQVCSVSGGSGTQTWNQATLTWNTCSVTSCTLPYELFQSACYVPQYRTCQDQPNNSVPGTGTQKSYTTGSWLQCRDFTCNSGYEVSANGIACSYVVSLDRKLELSKYNTDTYLNLSGSIFLLNNGIEGQLPSQVDNTAIYGSLTNNYVLDPVSGWFNSPAIISTGFDHSCTNNTYNSNQKKVYCWGNNDRGQLGNNSSNFSNAAVNVFEYIVYEWGTPYRGIFSTKGSVPSYYSEIKAGNKTTCGIVPHLPAVRCWGDNTYGQLGSGTVGGYSSIPTSISNNPFFVAYRPNPYVYSSLAMGNGHVCMLNGTSTAYGEVYCWGDNTYGQLGGGNNTSRSTPAGVYDGSSALGMKKIVAGAYHTCGIYSSGAVGCWGQNNNSQLGNNSTINTNVVSASGTASFVYTATGNLAIIDIAAGTNHTCAIASNGKMYCWGLNTSGQLGIGSTAVVKIPTAVVTTAMTGAKTFKSVTAGSSHTCGISTDDITYCWGINTSGKIGTNSTTLTTVYNIPTPIATTGDLIGNTLSSISAGSDFTCGISNQNYFNDKDNNSQYTKQLFCWGNNSTGKIANQTSSYSIAPQRVLYQDNPLYNNSYGLVKKVNTSSNHTCTISADDNVYCWGDNTYGQLGDNTTFSKSLPVAVLKQSGILASKTVKDITVGKNHTCAIASDNNAYCWGQNNSGQLGSNSVAAFSSVPMLVSFSGGLTVKNIYAGESHTCAIASDNNAYCWGFSTNGQLGNGGSSLSRIPVAVSKQAGGLASLSINSMSVGTNHTCVVASNNNAYCWGSNTSGQLGNSNTSATFLPVAVNTTGVFAGKTIKSIVAGAVHTCAIANDDNAYCWGSNTSGQFGDGTVTSSSSPKLSGIASEAVKAIYLGVTNTCKMLTSNNKISCAGLLRKDVALANVQYFQEQLFNRLPGDMIPCTNVNNQCY